MVRKEIYKCVERMKYFMKELVKEILIGKEATSLNKIISLIQNSGCKVVSFDIFDTLIKRNLRSANDIFKILEFEFNQHFNKSLPILLLEIVGPVLYGYCKWLIQKLKEKGISRVYFLAREGFTLEKAFEMFRPYGISYHVIRVSRRATALPLLYRAKSLHWK